jgi:hypothetical protein
MLVLALASTKICGRYMFDMRVTLISRGRFFFGGGGRDQECGNAGDEVYTF